MTRSRGFVFMATVDWEGWACKGCEWRRRLPDDPDERASLVKRVETEFDAHDCDDYRPRVNGSAAA